MQDVDRRLERALKGGLVEFVRTEGRNEAYYKKSVLIRTRTIEIFVYLDEAGFMIDGRHWHVYEKADFPTDEELISALGDGLERWLSDDVA